MIFHLTIAPDIVSSLIRDNASGGRVRAIKTSFSEDGDDQHVTIDVSVNRRVVLAANRPKTP